MLTRDARCGVTGISNFEYASLGQEAIMAELDKKYPDFEKRTGWRLDSAYKEMPEDLAQEVLHKLFIGRRPFKVHEDTSRHQ